MTHESSPRRRTSWPQALRRGFTRPPRSPATSFTATTARQPRDEETTMQNRQPAQRNQRPPTAPAMPAANPQPVGITKGPGETIHEYTFVSRDERQVLKNGEYVYYELLDMDQGESTAPHNGTMPLRSVLGRIMKRVPLQLYPDTFLGEPEISPA